MSAQTGEPIEIDLAKLQAMMLHLNVRQLLVKSLAPNDNSKNQVYLGGNLEIANILPMGELTIETSTSQKDKTSEKLLKAPVPFHWLRPDGSLEAATGTQIILYPQYPEIRLSGFLRGTQGHPNRIMRSRDPGRVLLLGITKDRKVVAWAASAQSAVASDLHSLRNLESTGLLQHIPIGTADTSRKKIIDEFRRIHRLGWIKSQRMQSDASIIPCIGTNCGGYTLEAQLGIIPNGKADPDFDGWEVKGHKVSSYSRLETGNLTLMTPQPTGGYYASAGVIAFVQRYGYADKAGKADRLNFSSPHRTGVRNRNTSLTLAFAGFNPATGEITDPAGGIVLLDTKDRQAAVWHFAGLLNHWKRKHAKAAYVPYLSSNEKNQYAFGDRIRLGEDTDFTYFLRAMASGKIIYDPGIKVEEASSARPRTKQRSQFRIKSASLAELYKRFETVALSS